MLFNIVFTLHNFAEVSGTLPLLGDINELQYILDFQKKENKMTKRVPTRLHTRKLDRAIARNRMKEAGISSPAKHDLIQTYNINGKKGEITRTNSFFAEHWKEYAY